MAKYRFAIVIRCSDDSRLFDLLNAIDTNLYEVIVSITPNMVIEAKLNNYKVKYCVTPKGNTARNSIEGIKLSTCDRVLLLDSDCLLFEGTLNRYYEFICKENPDFIRPCIFFDANNFSSYLTKLQRTFQYTFFDYVYEPGLLVNLSSTLPKLGGYLFSEYAIYTPDGELDYRIRNSKNKFSIISDNSPSILHYSLDFSKNIKSHWRYGASEANVLFYEKTNVIKNFFKGISVRYMRALSFRYPFPTTVVVFICDIVYIGSFIYHFIKLKIDYTLLISSIFRK
jgi:hypothetical protein